jgi:hypothetical protein
MNYQQKQIYMEEQGDKYGVNKSDFDTSQGGGGGRYDTFNSEAYEKAVMKAANNDYDNREALKYAGDNEHFKGLSTKGISNAGELASLDRAMQQYGKKELGQSNTSSANDYGNISRSLFQSSREQLTDSMTANEQQDQAERGTAAPVSRELQDARDTVDELGNKDYDIFGANIDNGDNQNQRDQASQAFLGKYKLDLKQDKNFTPVLPS